MPRLSLELRIQILEDIVVALEERVGRLESDITSLEQDVNPDEDGDY